MKVDQFLDLYEKRTELTHYEILGVEENADVETVRKVFKKLAGELHIDRFLRFDFDESTLEKLKQLFITFNKAYQVLIDPMQRQEYDLERQLRGSDGEDSRGNASSKKRDLGQLLQAEQLVRESIQFIKVGKVDLAEQRVSDAIAINSDDPLAESVQIYIDGIRSKTKGASLAVLRQYIDRLEALTMIYDSREEPFLYLSILYGYCEEYARGLKAVEKSLEINPHFAEANSQIRHLQRLAQSKTKNKESGKSQKSGGFFRRR